MNYTGLKTEYWGPVYCASKFAINAYMMSWAVSLSFLFRLFIRYSLAHEILNDNILWNFVRVHVYSKTRNRSNKKRMNETCFGRYCDGTFLALYSEFALLGCLKLFILANILE